MQWGYELSISQKQINLPITYSTNYNILMTPINSHLGWLPSSYEYGEDNYYKTLSTFQAGITGVTGGSCKGMYWLTIGN